MKSHFVKFGGLDLSSLYIRSYSDASYNNLQGRGSQGGHVISC